MGVQNPNQRAAPKAATPKYSLPQNFHTEVQGAPKEAQTQYKLQRAIKPLRTPVPKADKGLQLAARNAPIQQKQALAQLRQHIQNTYDQAVAQHGARGSQIAQQQLTNEFSATLDQERLRRAALDRTLDPSHRLSAARQLREKYNVPFSTQTLLNPDRLKQVRAFLANTDAAIKREGPHGAGVPGSVLATADFNPIHAGSFLHTLGALSTAGANKLVGVLGQGQGPQFGQIQVTPKIVQTIGSNALKDALDLPAQSVVSAYDIGSAAWQAALKAHGTGGSYGPIKDVAKSTVNLLEHPVQHPLAALLVAKGGVSALDRAAGTAVRTATLGKVLGTGGRAPVKLYGKVEVPRRFGTGAVTNAMQRVLDAKRPGAALYNKFAGPVRDARRDVAAAENARGHAGKLALEDLRTHANRVTEAQQILEGRKVGKNEPLPILRDRALRQQVHEAVAGAEDQRKAAVMAARKELRASLPKPLRAALRPVIEGTIKSPETAVHDVHGELARLKDEEQAMRADPHEKAWRIRRNVRQQHVFEGLLENKVFLDNPHPAFEAADKFIETQRQMEAKLAEHGLLDPERALRSKLIPYAVREMGARYDSHTQRVLAEDGTPLSNNAIMSDAVANGVRFSGLNGHIEPQVGFISQRGDLGRLGDYFKDSTRGPSGYFQKRTGESAQKGLHNLGFKMVDAQMSHTMNVLAQAEHSNAILDRFGLKPPGDIAFTNPAHATNVAQEMSDKTGMGWVPVKIGQAVGEQLRAVHQHIDPAAVDMLPEHGQLPGSPSWLVMPSTVAKAFQEHANVLGTNAFQLGFQALTHAFRQTVLPLSPRWLAGNLVELAVRGAVEGTGPLSWTLGHVVLNRVRMQDEGAYNAFVAQARSGGLYASQVRADHYVGIERWTDRGLVTHFAKPIIYAFHHNASPLKHLAWAYDKYAGAIKWITPRVEKEFQTAAIGKAALHELRDMHGNWLNALPHWTGAIDDVAHGLLDTNKQIQFARYVDKVVGRYNKLSPATRNLVSGYMPFAMWYANAVRFVFVTLPKDHPIIQGWIAAGYVDTEKKRLAQGMSLSQDIPGGKKRIPDFLQGTITEKGGSHLPLVHYTPFGAFTDPGSLQGLVLPQINALPLALAGKNWMLNDLKVSPGTDASSAQERLKIGMYSALESMVPGLAVARRIREQGGSAYDNSTLFSPKTKPGTKVGLLGAQGSLRKVADPFRSYLPGSASGARSRAGSGIGSSGGNRFLGSGPADTLSPAAPSHNRFLGGG